MKAKTKKSQKRIVVPEDEVGKWGQSPDRPILEKAREDYKKRRLGRIKKHA